MSVVFVEPQPTLTIADINNTKVMRSIGLIDMWQMN
jgi:hypothetical protein